MKDLYKLRALTVRNVKEILRDPLSFVFCLAFPLVMLVLFELIFSGMENVPQNYSINSYASGMAVFGYTFTMLFLSLIITTDRGSSFINRMLVAPVSDGIYLLSYALAAIPITIGQTVIFFAVALCFGLSFNAWLLLGCVYLIPAALLFISIGMFFGVIAKNEKQAGPICSIIITATGILGGIWMPVKDMGGGFYSFCKCLPFVHATEMASGAINGDASVVFPSIFILLAYTIVFFVLAVIIYRKKTKV